MTAQLHNTPSYEYFKDNSGVGLLIALSAHIVEHTPGQLWDRLAEHSELASGHEEHFMGPDEVDNIHDTDEYLFSDD